MVNVFVVPVFHHGENFVRASDRSLVYQNGKEERFSEMDLDFVNFGDLVTLFKGLGYQSYKAVYWYDQTSANIESGLNILTGDAGINAMRENILKNQQKSEFHIYFDHPVDDPEVVDDAAQDRDTAVEVDEVVEELNTSSSSDDEYESTEDVLYKPRPVGIESDSTETDSNGRVAGGKRKRCVKGKKKVVTPKKSVANKQGLKKKSKQGKRKMQFGTRVNERGEGSGNGNAGTRAEVGDQGPDVQPDNAVGGGFYVSEVPTEMEEIMFEYESEDLHTPISSKDEGRGNKFPEFDDDYAHGEGRFELGTRFATIDNLRR